MQEHFFYLAPHFKVRYLKLKKHLPFIALTTALFIGLIVPFTLQDGMFMDGLLYATVSRNLALGEGSFWFPYLSDTHLPKFHEQLPLFFAVESLFFRLLGDTIYAERICSLVMACLTAFFIILTWKKFFKDKEELKGLYWLPVLMWVATPLSCWIYINNMEETMMSVFATASVYSIVKALNNPKQAILYLLLGGFATFLCSFCKGFQGLFPLAVVGCYWVSMRTISFKKMLLYSGILLAVPLAIYGLCLLNEHSYLSLKSYFENRIFKTFFMESRGTTTNRFHMIIRLSHELIPMASIAFVIGVAYFIKIKDKAQKPLTKAALFFFLIGLSATLPLMATLEQRNFYRATSMPFFALAFAIIIAPYCSRLIESINPRAIGFKIFRVFTIACIFIAIGLCVILSPGTKRHGDLLPDIHAMGDYIGEYKTVSFPRDQGGFAPRLYFMRHYHISVGLGDYNHHYLVQANASKQAVPDGYSRVDLVLTNYQLYVKATN